MAQLRDVRTGEAVFEGSPLECIVHAGELGGAAVSDDGPGAPDGVELVYDDVGLGFDPDAVLEAARQDADGLATAAKAVKDKDERDRLKRAAAERAAELKADPRRLTDAGKRLERARKDHRPA